MCFVGFVPLGLDVDTATGNLYFTYGTILRRFTKKDKSQTFIYRAAKNIYGIAIDQLNRYQIF